MIRLIITILIILPTTSYSQTYEITYKNRSKQTLTSSVCTVHTRKAAMFKINEPASEGLANLAQDGVTSGYVNELRSIKGIRKIKVGSFSSAGSKEKITIPTRSIRGRLSCVFGMLVVTNDAFPAFSNMRLPRRIGKRKRFRAFAYDAGSEVNTESCNDVPGGPCNGHFTGIAENGVISRHLGIQGIEDLNINQHGWSEPAVRGTIKRIN